MKPFNLEEYLKNTSRKVVTRDGESVRIICTDANNEYPIVGLITKIKNDKNEIEEVLMVYTIDGKYCNEDSNIDLFFAPTKMEGWINIYQDPNEYPRTGNIYETKEEAITKKDNINYKATIKIEWEE